VELSVPVVEAIDTRLDRLAGEFSRTLSREIAASVLSGSFYPGDSVWIRYQAFTHTDSLRDRDTRSLFKTRDNVLDLDLEIEMSQSDGEHADFPYNNL